MEVRKVDTSWHRHKIEGTHFVSSIFDHWDRCIRGQVQPYTPLSGGTDWRLPVILTLRTWAVWNRNKRLSVILPILLSIACVSCLVILVRFDKSITCTSDLHFVLDFPGWFWLIYFTVVGAPPYPGFNGCLMTSANQDIGFLWAILLIWDARKCEYAIQCHCSSDWKGSVANAHVGTCHPFLWEIPVLTWFWWLVQCILIFSI